MYLKFVKNNTKIYFFYGFKIPLINIVIHSYKFKENKQADRLKYSQNRYEKNKLNQNKENLNIKLKLNVKEKNICQNDFVIKKKILNNILVIIFLIIVIIINFILHFYLYKKKQKLINLCNIRLWKKYLLKKKL